jgi:hypothetical protein
MDSHFSLQSRSNLARNPRLFRLFGEEQTEGGCARDNRSRGYYRFSQQRSHSEKESSDEQVALLPPPLAPRFTNHLPLRQRRGIGLARRAGGGSAPCPVCGSRSERVHSRYTRTASDLPWRGIAVTLKVRARKFFCDRRSCEREIFCERLEEIAARARKTGRLEAALVALALELGGEAGARVALELGLRVSADVLLERIRRTPRATAERVKVLGIDDWAFRRGHRYGTILVDLERHEVIDLLEDRQAESVIAWLKRHPEITVITRDRSGEYAEAAGKGAPQATQVADRWHLLHNLADALEEFLLQNKIKRCCVRRPEPRHSRRKKTTPPPFRRVPLPPIVPGSGTRDSSGGQQKAPRAPRGAVEEHPEAAPCRSGRPRRRSEKARRKP